MGLDSQVPAQPTASLTTRQVKTFQKVEPKALGVSASTQKVTHRRNKHT